MLRNLLAVLALTISTTAMAADAPKKLLLLGQGPDGHPPQTHEYLAGLKVLHKCLQSVKGLEVTLVHADEPWKDGPELIERADGVVLFLSEGVKWLRHDPRRRDALAKMLARGGGVVVLHWAMGTRDASNIEDGIKLLGGCHGGPDRKYKVLETDVQIVGKHPITTGIRDFRVKEEFYYQLKFASPEGSVQPLLKAKIEDQPYTVCWAWERPAGGRAFGFSGFHFHDNWHREEYRRLAAQAVLWTMKLPIPAEGLRVEVTEEDLKVK
jgi:type 1 glutamine amidotransferase